MSSNLYVVQLSPARKFIDALIFIGYLAFVVYWYWSGHSVNFIRDGGASLLWLTFLFLSNLLGRIKFTERGVERRTWYGRTVFSPYDEMLALEEPGKYITIQCRAEELKIEKKRADLSKVSDILRPRAARYGYDS